MDPIEQEIQAKGLTAPRITAADIEAAIASEHYFTADDGVNGYNQRAAADDLEFVAGEYCFPMVTFCVILLKNGHRIVGVNEGPVSAENFDPDLGRKLAREKALDQIWPLEGYLLREKLAAAPAAPAVPQPKAYAVGDIFSMMIEHARDRGEIDLTMTMTDGTQHKASVPDSVTDDQKAVERALAEINSRGTAP